MSLGSNSKNRATRLGGLVHAAQSERGALTHCGARG